MGQHEPKMVVVQCKCGKTYRVKSRVSDANYYTDSPIEDPAGPAEGRYQVRRGGGRGDPKWSTRSAYRSYLIRGGTFGHLGFRLALIPEE